MTRVDFWRSAALSGMALAACSGGGSSPAAAQDQDAAQRFIDVRVESDEGRTDGTRAETGRSARIKVRVRDPATGFAIGGLYPAAWIVPDDGTSCGDWYARIVGNPLLPDEVAPLIGYELVQATTDGRVAVIDPVLNLASANIRSLRSLPATPSDWEVSGDGRAIALVAAAQGRLDLMMLGTDEPAVAAALPAAHSVAAADKGFWIGLRDGRAVHLSSQGTVSEPIGVGTGPVTIVPGAGDFSVAIAADGKGRFLDRSSGRFRDFDLGHASGAGVFSPLADSFFALDRDGTLLSRVDLFEPSETARYPLPAAFRHLAADPRGRWLALRDESGASISIFDTQTMRVRWTVSMPDPVVEMQFSDNFLYLMHRRQGGVTRVILDPRGSAPGLAAIAAGVASDTPQQAGPLGHMVRIPGGGIFVASMRERQAYMISEDGAQAAMSSLPLRAGLTAGIKLRLRGLLPTANAGEYEARFTPAADGRHLALVQTEAPKLLHCAPFIVGGAVKATMATRPRPPAAASYSISSADFRAPSTLRFRISGGRVKPAEVMLMRDDGGWRQFLDNPVADKTDFVVAVDPAPQPGRYRLYVKFAAPDGSVVTVAANIAIAAVSESGALR